MQRLARVDVAQPGDHTLIEKRELERHALPRARLRQGGAVEPRRQRLGSHPAEGRMLLRGAAGYQIHDAEPPRIVEGNHRAGGHLEHHVVVWIRRIVDHAAERPGHAQVDEQDLARRELGEQILPPPRQRAHRLSAQPLGKALGKRLSQVRATEHDAPEARAAHHELELTPHGVYFRQLWHGHLRTAPGDYLLQGGVTLLLRA